MQLKLKETFLAAFLLLSSQAASHPAAGLAARRSNYHRSRPLVDHLVSQVFSAPIFANSVLERNVKAALEQRANHYYEVLEHRVELTLELPGVARDDLRIELDEDDHVLHIQGSRVVRRNGRVMRVKFDQTFPLEDDVDPASLEASLADGVLRVRAQRKQRTVKKMQVPISSKPWDDDIPSEIAVDGSADSSVSLEASSGSSQDK